MNNNSYNDGCMKLFSSGVGLFALIMIGLVMFAAVSAWGISGIIMGPIICLIAFVLFAGMFSH